MGWGGDDTTHASCFAIESSFTLDATLLDLVLPLTLRYLIFDATLLGLVLPLLLRYLVFDAKFLHLKEGGPSLKRVCQTSWLLNVVPNKTLTFGSISAVPNGVGRRTAQVCWPKRVNN